ncbi:MAG: DUF3656 domain-containing protein [archaeon]|nr:DUF3656 domain-containing protein [archaeon]
MKIPELLAPVGSSEHLKTAILAGASSIYLSGENFGARKYAENFTISEIREAVNFAHVYNVKVYVTVNTLIKENELAKVSNYLLELYKIGVDAVLIQDIGLVKIINENIPKLNIHASTQMNIHNIEGIKWAKDHNIKRIVLPREIEMKELKELIKYAHEEGIEIEIFAHGALCYSYSGHCLLSSFQGGRSGNRGTCAQPCREPYDLVLRNEIDNQKYKDKIINPKTEGNYLLSPRDLSLYENLGEIVNLNIDSIKIEGRMRSKDYVYTVVNNYRQRLNKLRHDKSSQILNQNIKNAEKRTKNKKAKNFNKKKQEDTQRIQELKTQEKTKNKKSIEELELVFNREFTTGHLIPKNNQNIINRKKPGHNGLYIGNIHRYNDQTQEILISLNDDLLTIPEKGDGLLIEMRINKSINETQSKTKNDKQKGKKQKNNKREENRKNKNMETYGFDISSKPTLKDPKDKHWRKKERDKDITSRILIVKKVKENKKVPLNLKKGDKVYLTKRNSLTKNIKDSINDKSKQSYKKSVLDLYFRIDKNNYPHLKGNLKLNNKQVLTIKIKGNKWEEAIKKPISGETIEKQLRKIGDLPYYIQDLKIDLNSKALFAPISQINELRREFFNKLEEEIIKYYKPNDKDLANAISNIEKLNKNLEILKSKSNNKLNLNEPKNLSLYINNLESLKYISENNTLENGDALYNTIYIEIPCEKNLYEISKDNLENYNPLKSKKLNISYCTNFLKEAIKISQGKNYKLVWKWPDIIPIEDKESLIQIIGILNKMNLPIEIMTSLPGISDSLNNKFKLEVYGNYPLNVFNIETVIELNKFKRLSISPELYKGNIKKLLTDYYTIKHNLKDNEEINLPELELLVHGNIESMISRKEIISKKQLKLIEKSINKNTKKKSNYNKDNNNYLLKSRKDQYYPIKTNIIEDNIIILNSEDFCLIDEITYLVENGLKSFSIDCRWKSKEYIREVGKTYKKIINSNQVNIEEYKKIMNKFSKNRSKGNFNTGLK